MTIRKSAAAWVMAALFPGAGIGSAAEPAPSGLELPVISIEAFAEAGADPRLILIDLRDQAAITAAMIEGAMRPSDIGPDEIADQCITVLVADPNTAVETITAAAARFQASGCEVRLLAGDADAWWAAGLAAPARPRGQRRPGEVPFIVPRGLCDGKEPAQVFD